MNSRSSVIFSASGFPRRSSLLSVFLFFACSLICLWGKRASEILSTTMVKSPLEGSKKNWRNLDFKAANNLLGFVLSLLFCIFQQKEKAKDLPPVFHTDLIFKFKLLIYFWAWGIKGLQVHLPFCLCVHKCFMLCFLKNYVGGSSVVWLLMPGGGLIMLKFVVVARKTIKSQKRKTNAVLTWVTLCPYFM